MQRWVRGGLELAGLLLALSFVFAVAYVPHLDTQGNNAPSVADQGAPGLVQLADAWWEYLTGEREGYPYTIHVDENKHWAYFTGVQRTDQAMVSSPQGDPVDQEGLFSLRGAVHERGYHVLMAQTQELTGVGWFRIHQFLPALWTAFTAFALYAALRPHSVAIPAAAAFGLVHSTPRFLGPAFLTPIGFALAWIPVALLLAPRAREHPRAALLLTLLLAWTFFVHMTAGFAAVFIVVLALLLSPTDKASLKRSVVLVGLALLPVAWLFRSFKEASDVELGRELGLPLDLTIFDGIGWVGLLAWAIGLLLMVARPPTRARTELIGAGALSTLSLAFIVWNLAADTPLYAFYARWHPIFFLTGAVAIGYAVVEGPRWLLEQLEGRARAPAWVGRVGRVAVPVLLLAAVVSPGVAGHIDEQYYHVLEEEDWQRYQWALANLDGRDAVFLSEPWEAPVYAAVSGSDPYTWLNPGNPPINGPDYGRYLAGNQDLSFFVMNDITLILDERAPGHGVFEQVHPGVWVMKEPYRSELLSIRAAEANAE